MKLMTIITALAFSFAAQANEPATTPVPAAATPEVAAPATPPPAMKAEKHKKGKKHKKAKEATHQLLLVVTTLKKDDFGHPFFLHITLDFMWLEFS